MNSQLIRQAFLDYFKAHGHEMVASSSLVPGNDPTLLFTNAGMVQFKETFLGLEARPYTRAASVQRCMRAGGKHNDLENVGYTARHHTFFEMLGNFSFGDYFKADAIRFAWEFLTKRLAIPKERLWVTVYKKDPESEAIWLNEIGIDPKRFSRCGEKDNFWQMGDTGPCGPCTEIFYDHGPKIAGGPPGSPDQDGDRYVEIWNLVFMQYDHDLSGNLHPLPQPCVDTGMGLERVSAVMQGVHDNYETDLFKSLLNALTKLVPCDDTRHHSMRVIVDHIRSTAFLISDGVVPSNEGRGYVLRRIIRRAVRHGYKLGQHQPFFYKLVPALVAEMQAAYPQLLKSQKLIEQILQQEEEQFARTLSTGLKILDQAIAELESSVIPGRVAFQLYDTYGFPADLTADVARERGLRVDEEGFHALMERQREQSQQAQQFSMDHIQKIHIVGETEFVGYESLDTTGNVLALLQDSKPVSALKSGEAGVVIIDRTTFYAESGGQVGDQGYLEFDGGKFLVKDTQKQGAVYFHIGVVQSGELRSKTKVFAHVDAARRQAIRLNHTATHLLHEALRRVLGEHVHQKGSLVAPDRLRFDFSQAQALTPEQIRAVEHLVNQQIRANLDSEISLATPEEAQTMGALALFGERYGKQVRVLKMGEFSHEICGGTHVEHTGDIGFFKIVSESACAAGVRRIEAVTGEYALAFLEIQEKHLRNIANLLKTNTEQVLPKLEQVLQQTREHEKEMLQLKQQLAVYQADELIHKVQMINGVAVLALELKDVDRDLMRQMLDRLKNHWPFAAIVLASVFQEKLQLVAGVTKNCLAHFSAVDLLKPVADKVGGKCGGRADMAQGGGEILETLPDALKDVAHWVQQTLGDKQVS